MLLNMIDTQRQDESFRCNLSINQLAIQAHHFQIFLTDHLQDKLVVYHTFYINLETAKLKYV